MKTIFIIFLSIVTVERSWETFLSNKSEEKGVISGGWTLWALTFIYILIIISTLIETVYIQRTSNHIISIIG